MKMKFKIDKYHGKQHSYSEEVTVVVSSGERVGEDGHMEDVFKKALKTLYPGAQIEVVTVDIPAPAPVVAIPLTTAAKIRILEIVRRYVELSEPMWYSAYNDKTSAKRRRVKLNLLLDPAAVKDISALCSILRKELNSDFPTHIDPSLSFSNAAVAYSEWSNYYSVFFDIYFDINK